MYPGDPARPLGPPPGYNARGAMAAPKNKRAKQPMPPQVVPIPHPIAPRPFPPSWRQALRSLPADRQGLACKLLKDENSGSAETILTEFSRPSSQLFDALTNPAIPMVYTRFPGVDLVYLSPSATFQFDPRPDALFIGLFLHIAPSSGVRETVFADDREMHPRTFAEGGGRWFPLQRARISPRTDPPASGSWFVIVPVVKKSVSEVILETAKSALPPDDVVAKMPKCTCNGFSLARIVEQVQAAGDAKCPTCGEQIVLAELELSLRLNVEDDDTREMKEAKRRFFDMFAWMTFITTVDGGWEEAVFGNAAPDDDDECGDLNYQTTEEYLELMDRLT